MEPLGRTSHTVVVLTGQLAMEALRKQDRGEGSQYLHRPLTKQNENKDNTKSKMLEVARWEKTQSSFLLGRAAAKPRCTFYRLSFTWASGWFWKETAPTGERQPLLPPRSQPSKSNTSLPSRKKQALSPNDSPLPVAPDGGVYAGGSLSCPLL